MSLRKPSDLGYSDRGYDLPPLTVEPVVIRSEYTPPGQLFATGLKGVGDRAQVRKGTLGDRIGAAAQLIAAEPDEQWIAWVGLNDESDAIAAAVPGAVVVEGSQSPDEKAARLERFAAGETRVLVTKATVAGYGLNLQRCARVVFVGLGDSFEQFYQAVRRCWRFGQQRPVHVYVVLSDLEEPIFANVRRKEREADEMATALVRHVAAFERAELRGADVGFAYEATQPIRLPDWLKEVA
jgi:superfamily II DNA or RNA helicase